MTARHECAANVVMDRFPALTRPEQFTPLARDETQLRPGVLSICETLGIACAPRRFLDGSLPVYALGSEFVLKIYPPPYFEERTREASVLQVLDRQLPIATPGVHAIGEFEGWGYLLMDQLPGESLAVAWQRISRAERMKLARQLGEALRVLHSVSDPRLADVTGDWAGFIEQQRQTVLARQQHHGLEQRWLEQIPDLFQSTPLAPSTQHCLLHTEVMREHVLVQPDSQGWSLSGLIDFEPSMLGAAEYEFASVGVFFSCGDAALLRQLLLGYGYRESELCVETGRRFLVYALLHRFSNFPWYLQRMPPPGGLQRFEQLATLWWGLE